MWARLGRDGGEGRRPPAPANWSPVAETEGKPGQGRVFWELAFTASLFGAVGLFAKALALSPGAISFGRSVFAAAALALVTRLIPAQKPLERRDWPAAAIATIGQAGNWSLFFASAQVSSVSIAILSLFTYPILTALAEPFWTKRPPRGVEVVGALLVLAGVVVVQGQSDPGANIGLGVLLGVLSAAFLTARNLAATVSVERIGAVRLNLITCAACIPLFLPFRVLDPAPVSWKEAGLLLLLGVAFTALPQVLFFRALRYVSAAYASLVVALQPLFTLLFAFILLGERPTPRTLAGGILILSAVGLVAGWRAKSTEPPA